MWVMLSELFPTRFRGASYWTNWVCEFVHKLDNSANFSLGTFKFWQCFNVFHLWIFSFYWCNNICQIFTFETKGKTLEEIEIEFVK